MLPWQLGGAFQSFVKTILMQLPMKEPWDERLLSEAGLQGILEFTDGITGEVIQSIKGGAVDALKAGRESIRLEDVMSVG